MGTHDLNDSDSYKHLLKLLISLCELLHSGMTKAEVSDALLEVGSHKQVGRNDRLPNTEGKNIDTFQVVRFEDLGVEFKYQLLLGLGYDINDQLVLVSRRELHDYHTVECPWK